MVIGPDLELDAPQAEPVVCQLDHRRHQRTADTPILKRIVHRHAHGPHVTATRGLDDVQAQVADDPSIDHGYQPVGIRPRLAKAFASELG